MIILIVMKKMKKMPIDKYKLFVSKKKYFKFIETEQGKGKIKDKLFSKKKEKLLNLII